MKWEPTIRAQKIIVSVICVYAVYRFFVGVTSLVFQFRMIFQPLLPGERFEASMFFTVFMMIPWAVFSLISGRLWVKQLWHTKWTLILIIAVITYQVLEPFVFHLVEWLNPYTTNF